jgi:hypothetical protein
LRIFAYWDNPDCLPAYLQLCVATWKARGEINEVHLITDANLPQWVEEGVLDLVALQAYPVPQRKDAIEVAVLARYGGLFIDLDTICSGPLVTIQRALVDHQLALYGFHMAAVAAQPGAAIVSRWLQLVQQTLALPREQQMAATGLDYTELGNYSFELLRDELATGRTATPCQSQAKVLGFYRRVRRYLMFRFTRQQYIARISPISTGYIAEYVHRRDEQLSPQQRYRSFWFDEQLPVAAVYAQGGALIGLHHSWTPPAYTAKGLAELAQDQTLLSRYLRSLLGEFDRVDLSVLNLHKPEGL